MSIIRLGSTKQYADGWELVFGGTQRGGKSKPKATAKAAPKAAAAKRTAKKKKKASR